MKKKTKRVIWIFLPIDYKAAEAYLINMAQRGWMLVAFGRVFAKFESIEPSDLVFTIDVFTQGGPLTPDNTQEAKQYREFCEQFGWKFVTSMDYLQVFYAHASDQPARFQTDEVIEQALVEKTLLKNEYVSIVLMSILLVAFLNQMLPFTYKSVLTYGSFLSTFLLPPMFLFVMISNLITVHRVRKAKKRVSLGLSMNHRSLKQAKRASAFLNIPALVCFVLLMSSFVYDATIQSSYPLNIFYIPLLSFSIGGMLRYIIKKKTTNQNMSMMITIVVVILFLVFMPIVLGVFFELMAPVEDVRSTIINDEYRLSIHEIHRLQTTNQTEPYLVMVGSSPILKTYVHYSETTEADDVSLYLSVEYFHARSIKHAQWLFDKVIQYLEDGITYQGELLWNTPMQQSEHLKLIWDVDQVAISTKDKETIVFLKGDRLLKIEATVDYEDPFVIQLIKEKFLTNESDD